MIVTILSILLGLSLLFLAAAVYNLRGWKREYQLLQTNTEDVTLQLIETEQEREAYLRELSRIESAQADAMRHTLQRDIFYECITRARQAERYPRHVSSIARLETMGMTIAGEWHYVSEDAALAERRAWQHAEAGELNANIQVDDPATAVA